MVDGSNAALGGLQIGDVIRGTTARSKVFHFRHHAPATDKVQHPPCIRGRLSQQQSMPVHVKHRILTSVVHSLLWALLPCKLLKVLQSTHCANKYRQHLENSLFNVGRRERDTGRQWQPGQARLLGGTGAPQRRWPVL